MAKRKPGTGRSERPSGFVNIFLDPREFVEVPELLAQGKTKRAVALAEKLYEESPNSTRHSLLEEAYLARAKQLFQEGMPTAASGIVQTLVQFGVTEARFKSELNVLLVKVGKAKLALTGTEDPGRDPNATAERTRLLETAADVAVIHPDLCAEDVPELIADARRIRNALEAVEQGRESEALESIGSIPRGSPFADWRLFVRGWAAWHRRDREQAAANWDRLDPGRSAGRIARFLRGRMTPEDEVATAPRLEGIETAVLGGAVLGPLCRIREAVARDDWYEALGLLADLRARLVPNERALLQRLTRILIPNLILSVQGRPLNQAMGIVHQFVRSCEPLPIDPEWHRLMALIFEGPQATVSGAVYYWLEYIRSLPDVPSLDEAGRQRVMALVWFRIATLYSGILPPVTLPEVRRSKKALEQLRERVVACLLESLRLDAGLLAAREELFRLYQDWGRADDALRTAEELLRFQPDHEQALQYVSGIYNQRTRPDLALPYLLRLRKLKPLDEVLLEVEWTTRLSLARQHAEAGRWEEGRAEFDRAAALWTRPRFPSLRSACKAVFELKAGRDDLAAAAIEEGLAFQKDPAPFWLAAVVQAGRYALPSRQRDEIFQKWQAAIAGKPRSSTAGEMARLLEPYLELEIAFPGKEVVVREIEAYINRASRQRYEARDLAAISLFLSRSTRLRPLLGRLIQRGIKNAPDMAVFPYLAAVIELEKGPYQARMERVEQDLEKALRLAKDSPDPENHRLVPLIRTLLEKSLGVEDLLDEILGPMGLDLGHSARWSEFFEVAADLKRETASLPSLDTFPRPAYVPRLHVSEITVKAPVPKPTTRAFARPRFDPRPKKRRPGGPQRG